MSEQDAPRSSRFFDRRSLASRLTAWFTLSSFVLVVIATTSLYWSVTRHLRSSENHLAVDRVRTLRSVLHEEGPHVAELVEEVEHEWPGGPNAHVYARVLDGSGRVLTETHGMSQRDLPTLAFPSASAGGHVSDRPVDRSESSGRRFHLYSVRLEANPESAEHVILQLAIDATDRYALLATYRHQMLSVLAVVLLVAASVGFVVTQRGLKPIERFEETLRRIHSTTLNERLDLRGMPIELSRLATTCNRMFDGLEESFGKLSRFSADIAHELRTPINNLRGEVEVAIARQRSREEYRSVLESCLEEAERLSNLIDSLLFLARTEGAKVLLRREPLDLHRELVAVTAFYEALASEAGVGLIVDARGSLIANVDRALFQSAVGNLVHNAISATPRGGNVSVHAELEGSDVRIEVTDTGHGISPLDLPRVFDRLYRADTARASGGVGLGLAIVKNIAALHRGSASIRSEQGIGTTATLRFPTHMAIS